MSLERSSHRRDGEAQVAEDDGGAEGPRGGHGRAGPGALRDGAREHGEADGERGEEAGAAPLVDGGREVGPDQGEGADHLEEEDREAVIGRQAALYVEGYNLIRAAL